MFVKIIAAFLSLIMMLLGVGVPQEQKCKAAFNGTFMQPALCIDWQDEDWENEVRCMKEAGVEYLILQFTAHVPSEGTPEVYYPSELAYFEECEPPVDFIGEALTHLKGTGIKVLVGLIEFDDWWVKAGASPVFEEVCNTMALMEEEIYKTYYPGNEDTFYGWYFTPEIDNISTMRASIYRIIDGFNTVIDKADALNPALPMLMSPYYTDYFTLPSVIPAFNMWKTFMLNAHWRDGDIFCPQDAVGAGWVALEDVERVWKMYAAVITLCEKDIKLWANVENMITAREYVVFNPPATLEEDDCPADLSRFIQQMEIASKYAENIITFSYNHYMSPQTVNPVYHETYLDYLKNGSPETVAPSSPLNVTVADGYLTWEDAEDNIGIAYYIIYEDGEAVKRINAGETYSYPVKSYKTYEVKAVDGAGNVS